jgi:hypothetical protein
MSLLRKILLASGIVIILIQFIRPVRNESGMILTSDISKVVIIPDSVQVLLKNACYDCHSDNTHYPWYSNIQPVGWFMANHLAKAKRELNFSEFGTYSQRRQVSKLDGIANSIKDDIMPLKSYRLMHKSAQLTPDEKSVLINWVKQSTDSIAAKK